MPVWNQHSRPDSLLLINEMNSGTNGGESTIKSRNSLLTNLLCIVIYLKNKRRANDHHWNFERTEKVLLLSLVILLFFSYCWVNASFSKGITQYTNHILFDCWRDSIRLNFSKLDLSKLWRRDTSNASLIFPSYTFKLFLSMIWLRLNLFKSFIPVSLIFTPSNSA